MANNQFKPGYIKQDPGKSNAHATRPQGRPQAGPIEQYILKGGTPPKLDGLGNVRGCTNCS